MSNKALERQWARYKYKVMDKSYSIYKEISQKMGRDMYDLEKFYIDIQRALDLDNDKGQQLNTFYHIWGYFKNIVDETEKQGVFLLLDGFKNNKSTYGEVKSYLYFLSKKYNIEYLLNSYYFND